MDERKPDQRLVKNNGIYKQKTNQVEFSVNVLVISCRVINQHQTQLITDILSQFLWPGIWTWLSFQFWSSVRHEVVVKLSARAAFIQIWRIYFQFPSYNVDKPQFLPGRWPGASVSCFGSLSTVCLNVLTPQQWLFPKQASSRREAQAENCSAV